MATNQQKPFLLQPSSSASILSFYEQPSILDSVSLDLNDQISSRPDTAFLFPSSFSSSSSSSSSVTNFSILSFSDTPFIEASDYLSANASISSLASTERGRVYSRFQAQCPKRSSSTGRTSSPSPGNAHRSIAQDDMAKIEAGIMPLVPSCDNMIWLCSVLNSSHAAVYTVCAAILVRFADGGILYNEDEACALGAYRGLLLAINRFPDSTLIAEKATKILKSNASKGKATTSDKRRNVMMKCGILEVLFLTLCRHGTNVKSIANAACGTIAALAIGGGVSAVFAQGAESRKDAFAARKDLLKVILSITNHYGGLLNGKSAIINIAAGSEKRRKVIIAVGGSSILEEAEKRGLDTASK
jgi:hypothetical protein